MAQFSRTWWGKRFIQALEAFTDPARLGRGRSYANGGKVLHYKIDQNEINAVVKGSVNPYFGVYKEPTYIINIEITPIDKSSWSKAIKHLSSKASFVSKLLMNEVPDNIEDAFSDLGLHLLPHNRKDFKTNCSCPDYANPCKHIAGVYYLVASQLDHNPFLLFELRGLSKEALQAELAKSPLGEVLSTELTAKEIPLESSASYYTPLEKVPVTEKINPREFWLGTKRLPQTVEMASLASLPAILIKKQGDFPPFWKKDSSFIEVMEELYERVKTKNKEVM
ncbi:MULTISPECIES: SWIM zinc finger family protein [unclassified Coleofasciculus]|uniref:SWIM zinc finger family protein n=1 Tax=Cyanophyceae TaxID=3028117 RepID=UPI001684D340|nr:MULTISPECIES: SWIM zinc finger family protein [unclassified Coleofasciculus]MBD1892147.1 SWIM zinc finger family protein [Coleofasciculus sp. FACHB-SPT9]MBD1893442.1 SWIM zinc finger family protein [Coleofasciculus sp. FACHB-129]